MDKVLSTVSKARPAPGWESGCEKPFFIKRLTTDSAIPFSLASTWIYCYKVLRRIDGYSFVKYGEF